MSKRNYGIDLLRLVLMFMICIMHTVGRGRLLDYYEPCTLKYNINWLMYVLSCCSVDGFAIISGYVANDKSTKYSRLIELWFQVFFYSCFITLFFRVLGFADDYDSTEILTLIFPVTSKQYWYFTAYFGAFFFFPLIKKYVFAMKAETAGKMLILFFILFSVMEMNNDMFYLNTGTSLIWLIILYCIGALAKKCDLFADKKTWFLIMIFLISSVVSWLAYIIGGLDTLYIHISPTMLLNGLILVIVFARININGKIIKHLSPLAFGIYLFHVNRIIWDDFCGSVKELVSSNTIVMIIQVIGISCFLCVMGLIVDFIRKKLFDFLHIHELSIALEESFKKIIGNCSRLLR